MIPWKLDFAILSDLSANVFAALLLMLLVLLDMVYQTAHVDRLPADGRPIEATRDLWSVNRAPLRGPELVALLYERRPAADGLSIDLFDGRIELQRGNEPDRIVLDRRRDGNPAVLG